LFWKPKHNTDDGGQEMDEEPRHVQVSRWIMHRHRWEKQATIYKVYEAQSNNAIAVNTTSEQKQGIKQGSD